MERIYNIKIRLTDAEYKELSGKYQKLKFASLSAFLRHLIFSKKVEINFNPTDELKARELTRFTSSIGELNRQLAAIGSNINQVAKKVNSQQYVMRKDIESMQKYFDEVVCEISNTIKQIESNNA